MPADGKTDLLCESFEVFASSLLTHGYNLESEINLLQVWTDMLTHSGRESPRKI